MIIYEDIFKKHGLSATQQEIIHLVGTNKVILEIGSSTGYMTDIFLKNDCVVDVVEMSKAALVKLPKRTRRILNYSIEDIKIKKLLAKDYDFIIMADVLEHLVNPQKALKILYQIVPKRCGLIISLPNIASWVMRKRLFFKGDFEYQDSGLLDRTHLKFFTVNTLPKFLSENGWEIKKLIGTITRLPFGSIISKIPPLYDYLVNRFKNLSYYHFMVVAFKK